MTRNRRGLGAIAAALLALGCQQQTAVHIVPPEDGAEVLSFRLEVHESGICQRLAAHDQQACADESCGADFLGDFWGSLGGQVDPIAESQHFVTEGVVDNRRVSLGRDNTQRDLLVIADLSNGVQAYGCVSIAPGGGVESIPLWYPLCEALPFCVEAYEECEVLVDCQARSFRDRGNPPCALQEGAVQTWRGPDGVPCDPPPPVPAVSLAANESLGACSVALRDCARRIQIGDGGACPQDQAEPCLDGTNTYRAAEDYNCDRGHPICGDELCVGDREEVCFTGSCVGRRSCEASRWTDCVFDQEQCGGGDEDCDGAIDETAGGCSAGVAPRGDGCALDGTCVCGDGPECSEGRACCDGACVDPRADVGHCGACGVACERGSQCLGGICGRVEDRRDAGAPPPVDAGTSCRDLLDCIPFGNRISGCVENRCACGAGGVCAEGQTCCGGQCVTIDINGTSVFNCGVCLCGCRLCENGLCRGDGCQIVLDAGSADGG